MQALSQKLLYPKCHGSKFAEGYLKSVTCAALENGWPALRRGSVCLLQTLFGPKMVKLGQNPQQTSGWGKPKVLGRADLYLFLERDCDNQKPQVDRNTKGSRYHWRRNAERGPGVR